MAPRESSEDYLEAILVIRAERGSCRNADIAERLGVTRPSVTKALAGLSFRSLVEVAGRDVRLTCIWSSKSFRNGKRSFPIW